MSSAAPHMPTDYPISAEILSSPSFLNSSLHFFLGTAQILFHVLRDLREQEIYVTMLYIPWYKYSKINSLRQMKQPIQTPVNTLSEVGL